MKSQKTTVYVVDDSATVLRHSQFVLESAGYRVKTFRNSTTIRESIRREPPDLLILDYILPGQNGLKLAAELKQQYPDLPIVLLTGHGSEEIAVEALRSGIDDYIIKPFLPEIMIHVVARALQKSRTKSSPTDHIPIQQIRKAIHKLSQPLTAIYGEAQLALVGMSPDDPHHATFKLILEGCEELNRTVDHLRRLVQLKSPDQLELLNLADCPEVEQQNRN